MRRTHLLSLTPTYVSILYIVLLITLLEDHARHSPHRWLPYRGGRQAAARALPCVSPHNDAHMKLPQAYVVSGLSASHSVLSVCLGSGGHSLGSGGHCLGFERVLPCLGQVDASLSGVVTA